LGSLSKALKKSDNLSGLIGGLKSFIDKSKKKKDQDVFNKLMQDAIQNIKTTYSEQPENNLSILPDPKSQLGKDLRPPAPTDPKVRPEIPVNEQPADFILGDANQGKRLSPDEQRMNIQKQIAETMIKAGQLKNLNPNDLKTGLNILDLIGKSITPKPKTSTLKQFDPAKDLYEIDDNGNITLKKEGTPISKKKSIGSYTGADGLHHIQLYDPESDTVQDITSKTKVRPPRTPAGTTIKFPKAEKWKDIGSIINSIKYKINPVTQDIVENTPQEQKIAREIGKNKALGNMLPGAIDFMRTRIFNTWGRENLSQADFEAEILDGINDGELDPKEAQDLLDFNQFRPYLYDQLTETKKAKPE